MMTFLRIEMDENEYSYANERKKNKNISSFDEFIKKQNKTKCANFQSRIGLLLMDPIHSCLYLNMEAKMVELYTYQEIYLN